MEDLQVTVKQAATALGVTTRTVRLWIEAGKVAAEQVQGKYGPEWRLPAGELERLVNEERAHKSNVALVPQPETLQEDLQRLRGELTELRSTLEVHNALLEALAERVAGSGERSSGPGMDEFLTLFRELQQTLEEDSQNRRRELQQLQAQVIALAGDLEELTRGRPEGERTEGQGERESSSWWQRLRR